MIISLLILLEIIILCIGATVFVYRLQNTDGLKGAVNSTHLHYLANVPKI